jgi:hypothetical protein
MQMEIDIEHSSPLHWKCSRSETVSALYCTTWLLSSRSPDISSVMDQTSINGCLHIWNLILDVGAVCMVVRLGRRLLFMSSCIEMLTSYIVISGLSGLFVQTGDKAKGMTVIPMLFLSTAPIVRLYAPSRFLPIRDLGLRPSYSRYGCYSDLGSGCGLLQHLRQPNCPVCHWIEM